MNLTAVQQALYNRARAQVRALSYQARADRTVLARVATMLIPSERMEPTVDSGPTRKRRTI